MSERVQIVVVAVIGAWVCYRLLRGAYRMLFQERHTCDGCCNCCNKSAAATKHKQ